MMIYEELYRPISEFTELPTRLRNGFRCAELDTLYDVVKKTRSQLLCLPEVGKKNLLKLDQFLDERGLELGKEPLSVMIDHARLNSQAY